MLLTVVGIVLFGHPSLQDDIIDAALRQFPVVGSDLRANVHQLSSGNVLAFVFGLLWLVYGCLRLSRSAQVMMATVWGIGRARAPRISGGGCRGRWASWPCWVWASWPVGPWPASGPSGGWGPSRPGSAWSLSLAVNVAMYWAGFAIVVRIPRDERAVWPGAVVGGAGWTVLQFADALLVTHELRHFRPVRHLRHRPRPACGGSASAP